MALFCALIVALLYTLPTPHFRPRIDIPSRLSLDLRCRAVRRLLQEAPELPSIEILLGEAFILDATSLSALEDLRATSKVARVSLLISASAGVAATLRSKGFLASATPRSLYMETRAQPRRATRRVRKRGNAGWFEG